MIERENNTSAEQFNTLPPSCPVMAPLVEKKQETPRMLSLLFEIPDVNQPSFLPFNNRPGQFVMVWIPGMNEKPFVISYLSRAGFGITVMVRGDFSRRLAELKEGQKVGFRGPFGRGFSQYNEIPRERIAMVGGGCGMAPLSLLAESLPGASLIQGAPSEKDILYLDRFPNQIVFTEDGSCGMEGLPTDWLKGYVASDFDMIYTCGPEPMMKSILQICRKNNISCQVALERYMKCGIGVCGQCECDGYLVCKDGPVFSDSELLNMPSFGNKKRDAAGQSVSISSQASSKTSCKTN